MSGFPQPETSPPPRKGVPSEKDPGAGPPGNGNFEGQELQSALQLLVERAQYITGATGAALALSQGEEMVCRASAGSSGPAVGARLQGRSGLSGESIARRQLLRCDNAESDPRVNLETCRELGIASIVVLPLLARSGEVRGIFELFSDHAYAFEERDLIALERMADLTLTALDLAEKRPARVDRTPPSDSVALSAPAANHLVSAVDPPQSSPSELPAKATVSEPPLNHPLGSAQVHSALFQDGVPEPSPAPVPDAMRRVQKCSSCGFPVSEGRSLCVDCENKGHAQPESADAPPAEFVPAFLDSSALAKQSWLSANYVNLLAAMVLVLSIVVAVVVFRLTAALPGACFP